MKQRILIAVLFLGLGATPYVLADEVNPQIANCEEITDPDTQFQAELCSAHIGCKLTMGIHKACTKVKTFLSKLKNLTFGDNKDNKIDSNDVFDAAASYTGGDESFDKLSRSIKSSYDKTPKKQIISGEFEDGTKWVYEGPMVKGRRNGTGVLIAENGTMFRGDFVKGKQQGKGELFNGATHKVGDMVESKMSGKGIEINSNGSRYEGSYKDGRYDGRGTLKTSKGDVVEGSFKEGKVHGKAKYQWTDGSVYEGNFVNGGIDGYGKMITMRGNQYEGEWKASQMHGKGTFTGSDGTKYEGEWNESKKLNGVETKADGSKIEIANGQVVKTPQQRAAEIGSEYDQKISAASDECNSRKDSCDTKCASLALLSALSKSGDTQAHLRCTNDCDSESESCNQQVSALQQQKKQAVNEALAPKPQLSQSAAVAGSRVAAASGGAGSAATATGSSTLPESVLKGSIEINISDRLKNSEIRKVKSQVGAYFATETNLKNCQLNSRGDKAAHRKCELKSYAYDARGIKPSYKLRNTNRPFTNKPIVVPDCSFYPSSWYETATEDQSPEDTCYVLMMRAIHESMEFQIKYLNGGSRFFEQYASANMIPGTSTGDCKKDLTKVGAESQKIMQRRPSGAKLEAATQVSMYIKLNMLRVLEKSCKGKPEYEGAAEMRRLLGDVHASCTLFKTDTSMCIPKVAW